MFSDLLHVLFVGGSKRQLRIGQYVGLCMWHSMSKTHTYNYCSVYITINFLYNRIWQAPGNALSLKSLAVDQERIKPVDNFPQTVSTQCLSSLWHHWLEDRRKSCPWENVCHFMSQLEDENQVWNGWPRFTWKWPLNETVVCNRNKSLLPLTDPHDVVPQAHCVVHRCRRSVW